MNWFGPVDASEFLSEDLVHDYGLPAVNTSLSMLTIWHNMSAETDL